LRIELQSLGGYEFAERERSGKKLDEDCFHGTDVFDQSQTPCGSSTEKV